MSESSMARQHQNFWPLISMPTSSRTRQGPRRPLLVPGGFCEERFKLDLALAEGFVIDLEGRAGDVLLEHHAHSGVTGVSQRAFWMLLSGNQCR